MQEGSTTERAKKKNKALKVERGTELYPLPARSSCLKPKLTSMRAVVDDDAVALFQLLCSRQPGVRFRRPLAGEKITSTCQSASSHRQWRLPIAKTTLYATVSIVICARHHARQRRHVGADLRVVLAPLHVLLHVVLHVVLHVLLYELQQKRWHGQGSGKLPTKLPSI